MQVLLPIDRVGEAGIGRVTRDICRFLPGALPEGDRLITVGGRPPCSTAPAVRHIVARHPPTNRVARFFHEQAVIARAAPRADLIHLTDHRPVLASDLPFLITIHDLFFVDHPQWYPRSIRAYKQSMLKLALAKDPAAVVCVSEYTRERLLEVAPDLDGRAHVVHPGVEPEEASPPTGDHDFFLTVSTIEPRKNHLTLLAAFKLARERGLRLRWKTVGATLYGGGKLEEILRATPGVEYAGLVSDGERERLYRNASFVALPSRAEGFGFTPLEAMARGIPTVCSSGSALDATAGDAAVRIDPDDVEGWAEALLRLETDHDLRAQLRERGAAQVRKFDPRRSAQEYVEIYRAALA